jgi:hypothetical protein
MSETYLTSQPHVRSHARGFLGAIEKVTGLANGDCAFATTKVTTIKG